MIVFNGSSGSLGAYFGEALAARGHSGFAVRARLEDRAGLRAELDALPSGNGNLIFVQMAAKVSVPECERDPRAARETNVIHTLDTVGEVCDFGRRRGLAVTVVYVSSGHVYAAQPEGVVITEEHPLGPRSVYAHTKLEAERGVEEITSANDARCVVTRVFGLVAPRQPENYLLPGLLRRVIEGRIADVPGLSFARDYLDSRDVCQAILDLAARPEPRDSVFNVCSGRPVRLRDLLGLILRESRPKEADRLLATATEAPARPDDVPWIVGSTARLRAVLEREPQRIALAETVRDALTARIR